MKKMLLVALLLIPSLVFANGFTATDGRKVVATAGAAEALSASAVYFTAAVICAETDNTGIIVVGVSPIAALGTREGIPLDKGDCYNIPIGGETVGNLADVKIDSTVNGDGVTYHTTYNI